MKYTREEKEKIRKIANSIGLVYESKQNGNIITKDDILNVKIMAESSKDVNDFINQM